MAFNGESFVFAIKLCRLADKVERCKVCIKDKDGNVTQLCDRHKKETEYLEKIRPPDMGGTGKMDANKEAISIIKEMGEEARETN